MNLAGRPLAPTAASAEPIGRRALRILFLAISRPDADLVVEALVRAGYAPTALVLPDLAALPGALAAAPWVTLIANAPAPTESTNLADLRTVLDDQSAAMHDLSLRLNEIDEEVRRSLSAELHDRVGQSLVSLGLTLSAVRAKLLVRGTGSLVGKVDEALRVTDEMATQVRDVMAQLRPPVLDDFGMLAALRRLA